MRDALFTHAFPVQSCGADSVVEAPCRRLDVGGAPVPPCSLGAAEPSRGFIPNLRRASQLERAPLEWLVRPACQPWLPASPGCLLSRQFNPFGVSLQADGFCTARPPETGNSFTLHWRGLGEAFRLQPVIAVTADYSSWRFLFLFRRFCLHCLVRSHANAFPRGEKKRFWMGPPALCSALRSFQLLFLHFLY